MIGYIFDDFSPNIVAREDLSCSVNDHEQTKAAKTPSVSVDLDFVYEKGVMEGRLQEESNERLKTASDKRRAYFSLQKSVDYLSEKKKKEKIEDRKILKKITKAFFSNFFCDFDEKIINSTLCGIIEKYVESGGYADGEKITIGGNYSGRNSFEWNEKKIPITEDGNLKEGLLNIFNEDNRVVLKLNKL